MGADRLRILGMAAITVGLIAASTLVLDWFVIRIPLMTGLDGLGIDLRNARGCTFEGICATVPLSKMGGSYSTLAPITFWIALVFGVAVGGVAIRHVLTGDTQPSVWTKAAYGSGGIALCSTVLAAYLFAPSATGSDQMAAALLGDTLEVDRTWAPLVMLLGLVLGMITVFVSQRDDSLTSVQEPVSLPPARVVSQSVPAIEPVAVPAPAPVPSRPKLRFATRLAEITRAGIDARREDGSNVLVMWRDIVGAVARRMPPAHDGVTFVDIVSTAGATLRLLPSTRLTFDDGRVLDEGDKPRALAVLAVLADRCPDINFDPATRTFIETRAEAPQLPDVATLAVHDDRLA